MSSLGLRNPNALGHALIAGTLLPVVREALGCPTQPASKER